MTTVSGTFRNFRIDVCSDYFPARLNPPSNPPSIGTEFYEFSFPDMSVFSTVRIEGTVNIISKVDCDRFRQGLFARPENPRKHFTMLHNLPATISIGILAVFPPMPVLCSVQRRVIWYQCRNIFSGITLTQKVRGLAAVVVIDPVTIHRVIGIFITKPFTTTRR